MYYIVYMKYFSYDYVNVMYFEKNKFIEHSFVFDISAPIVCTKITKSKEELLACRNICEV